MRRAEAVLDAADDAMRVETVALEIDDRVDDVLNDFWPGERARLGDVADEDHRRPAALSEIHQVHAAVAKLRDRPWRRRQVRLVDHLDRVDDDDRGRNLVD